MHFDAELEAEVVVFAASLVVASLSVVFMVLVSLRLSIHDVERSKTEPVRDVRYAYFLAEADFLSYRDWTPQPLAKMPQFGMINIAP